MFFVELSMKVMMTPVVLARWVFSESVKLTDIARFIGIMELRIGIQMPMISAWIDAYQPGMMDGRNPRSSVNSIA